MLILTREQSRRVDRIAIDAYGIPGIVLMENAARGAASLALSWPSKPDVSPLAHMTVICGGGNNGGDGYAIARHLHNMGKTVRLVPVSDPANLSGDAAINFRICERMRLPCTEVLAADQLEALSHECRGASLLVDAILGTGFRGELKAHHAAVIARINTESAVDKIPVLAVDLPSGLDCDSGMPATPTIWAALTVTFAALKTGFSNPAAREYLGEVRVADIGIPPEILTQVLLPNPD